MIRRSGERTIKKVEHRFDGAGHIITRALINSDEELNNKGRMFSHITVAPHSGIGYHVHNGDMEIYYVLSGSAEYNDNGTITTIGPGDVTFTPSGQGHEVKNESDEPVELMAIILYS